MRVLVCGGRDYRDYENVERILDAIDARKHITIIIHGAARGADTLAGRWATEHGRAVETYPADWKTHGKAAGHTRNRQMLVEGRPDCCVAFPGGRGTANMVAQALSSGIKTLSLA